MVMCMQKDSEAPFRPSREDGVLWFISDVCRGQKQQHVYHLPELVFPLHVHKPISFHMQREAEIFLKMPNGLLKNKAW